MREWFERRQLWLFSIIYWRKLRRILVLNFLNLNLSFGARFTYSCKWILGLCFFYLAKLFLPLLHLGLPVHLLEIEAVIVQEDIELLVSTKLIVIQVTFDVELVIRLVPAFHPSWHL